MISSRALLAMLALTSGCYFYYPKNVPTLNPALRVEGEQITFTLDPIGGRHRVEKIKGTILIGGGWIVGPPIKFKNAVIYPFGKVF